MLPAPASASARRGRRGNETTLGPPSRHWRRGRGRRSKISSPFYCCSSISSSHCVFFFSAGRPSGSLIPIYKKERNFFFSCSLSQISPIYFARERAEETFFALSILPLFGPRHRLKCCPSLSSSSFPFPNGEGERKKRGESAFFRSFPCVCLARERTLQQVHLIQVHGLQNYLNSLD